MVWNHVFLCEAPLNTQVLGIHKSPSQIIDILFQLPSLKQSSELSTNPVPHPRHLFAKYICGKVTGKVSAKN